MNDEERGTASRDERVYFFNLDLADGDAVTLKEAVHSFPSSVARHLGVNVRVEKLPSELAHDLSEEIKREADCIHTLLQRLYDCSERRDRPQDYCHDDILCVFCSPSSAPAQLAIQANEKACWGVAIGKFVFVYHWLDGGVTVWHELLHALGALDCDDDSDHVCNRDNCIMRYAVQPKALGAWPYVCDHNIRCIRDAARLAT